MSEAAGNTEPSGILLLDKSPGMTSHDAVNRLRRLYGTKKVGHAGTLDPMATGLLVALIGRAAKASEYIVHSGKSYEGGLRFGLTSDTGDITGELNNTLSPLPSPEAVAEAGRKLTGEIMQTPPMYSAIKIGGRKLCDLARRGIEIDRPARPVTVYSLSLNRTGDADYTINTEVSGGTYIRTLITDLGDMLGCGAVMTALRRTSAAGFDISGAVTLETLAAMSEEERRGLLRPAEELFYELPVITLQPFFARLCRCGCPVYQKKIRASLPGGEILPDGTRVRLYNGDGFFALGESTQAASENGEGSEPAIISVKQF